MTPLKIGLIAAAIAMLMTAGWQHRVQRERHEEAERLRTENDQLRLLASQQNESRLVPSQSAEAAEEWSAAFSEGRAQPEVTKNKLATKGRPTPGALNGYRNEGTATPLATLQTLAWACDEADAALMEQLLVYDEDARQRTLRHIAAQGAENQSEFPPIEAAAAALYIEDGMRHPYPSAKILELARFEQLRPGRVLLHLPGANGDGYEFQQTAEGWKLVVTLAVVDAYIRQTATSASKVSQP